MSKLNSIKAKLAKILASFSQMSTDKAILSWAEDEDLAVGMAVKGIDEEGNEYDLEDGEYRTAEKVLYVIKDGKVDEIVDESENEAEEPAAEEEAFSLIHRMAQKFEESYADKEQRIMEAIRQVEKDAWLIDAGDDFAVAEVWNDEEMTSKYFRWAITWDEEGNPVLGERIEVKDAFVPVDVDTEEIIEKADEEKVEEEMAEEEEAPAEEEDKDEKIANLEAEVARLEKENGELQERIKELEGESAAEPVEEEFEKVVNTPKTGDKKLDKALGIFSAKRH